MWGDSSVSLSDSEFDYGDGGNKPTRPGDGTAGHARRDSDHLLLTPFRMGFGRLALWVMSRPDSIGWSTCRGVHTGYGCFFIQLRRVFQTDCCNRQRRTVTCFLFWLIFLILSK